MVTESGTQSTMAVNTAIVPTYVSNTASLSFGTVAGGSCSPELTISVIGANPGDGVVAGWPVSFPNSLMGMMRVSAANTVSVRVCNVGSASAGTPTDVFRATVVKSL